jgi:putative hydrolase of the HAD superfamily
MVFLKENKKEIEAVIFDLGNVLLDYSPRRFLGEMGFHPDLHDRLASVLFEDTETWSKLDRGTITNSELVEIASAKEPSLRKEIRQYLRKWPYYFNGIPKNVAAMYRIKEAGAKIYVLSNFANEVYAVIKKRNTFFSDFDGQILSYEHKVIKPEQEIYDLLIRSYQLNPEKSVFIDDMLENTQAAIRAGLNAIHLPACAEIEPFFIFQE